MINQWVDGQELSSAISCFRHTREVQELLDQEDEESTDGLERKKEAARKRAKTVRESAIFSRKKRGRSLTPGVKIIGSRVLDGANETDRSFMEDELKQTVIAYLLRKGGFRITEERLTDEISTKRDTEDVMEIRIARIRGLHEKWGLDRKFISKSIYAHRFENGAIFEQSLNSYGGYVSRTYYAVEGNEFRAFAQRNFRRP